MRYSIGFAVKISLMLLFGIAAAAQMQTAQLPVPSAGAAYQGPMQLEDARMTAEVGNSVANMRVELQFLNPTDQPVQEGVALAESKTAKTSVSRQLAIAPRALSAFGDNYQYAVTGDELKAVRFDPRLELGGREWLVRAKSTTIQIKLPPGIQQLVYSSLPGGKIGEDPADGRTTVTYLVNNQYLVPIVIKWNSEAQIEIRKTASREAGVLNIEVKIRNAGTIPLSHVVVSDDFHPGFVESGTPAEEFKILQGEQNDRRLVWSHPLDSLAPGETVVLKYQIRFRGTPPDGLRFGRTTVTRAESGELLGASLALAVSR